LEDDLLYRLATAQGDILDDIELIENLEKSKKISVEVGKKVAIIQITEAKINEASESYRPAASRGALIYFLMTDLSKIHQFYKYSLESFINVMNRSIDSISEKVEEVAKSIKQGEEGEEEPTDLIAEPMSPRSLNKRVDSLIDSITSTSFNFTRKGLLEKHKLIVSTMLTLRILLRKGILST